jgi:hypothetical protein
MSTTITAALQNEFGFDPRAAAAAVQTIAALVTFGNLAMHVLQEPAVHKAWLEAANDCSSAGNSVGTAFNTVAKAVSSVAKVGSEAAASWRSHSAA